jgi:hypothetical protein
VETYRDAELGLPGDPTRRAIFELLARHPARWVSDPDGNGWILQERPAGR